MKNIFKFLMLFLININIVFGLDLTRTGNIVNDILTKLQWQDDKSVTMTRKNWDYAKVYCENLTLDNLSDWRLPAKNELLSLIDYSKSNPAILEDAFQNINSNYYWSSTSNATLHDYAWYISFDTGLIGYIQKNNREYVRCVRVVRQI